MIKVSNLGCHPIVKLCFFIHHGRFLDPRKSFQGLLYGDRYVPEAKVPDKLSPHMDLLIQSVRTCHNLHGINAKPHQAQDQISKVGVSVWINRRPQ